MDTHDSLAHFDSKKEQMNFDAVLEKLGWQVSENQIFWLTYQQGSHAYSYAEIAVAAANGFASVAAAFVIVAKKQHCETNAVPVWDVVVAVAAAAAAALNEQKFHFDLAD